MELLTTAPFLVYNLGIIIQYIGILIVIVSIFIALHQFLLKRSSREDTRVELAKSIIFGLEFVIAADILLVTIATDMAQILQLGGIVIIRVLLGYALQKENIR